MPIAKVDVISHSELVSVIYDRRPWHGHQQSIQQFDLPSVVVHQRSQTPPKAQIDPHFHVEGVLVVHERAVNISHHLQRKLIMVTKKKAPLAVVGYCRSLLQDFDDRLTILLLYGHEYPRHKRKVKRRVEFITIPEIGTNIGGPLGGLSEKHPVRIC